VSSLVLDAGAFLAVERGDRAVAAQLRAAQHGALQLRSTGAVIAQVWRESAGRQVALARLLKAVDVRSVDQALGRAAGVLLGRAGGGDAVDATVVAVAVTGDRILTSDPGGIGALADASGRSIVVVAC
jgi:hypothetical protein